MVMVTARKLPYYIADAFATGPFTGNPAGVFILQEQLSDDMLQKISSELNQPMTAFVTPSDDASADYRLRWFTPYREFPLCGHATLATLHVLFSHSRHGSDKCTITFQTQGGLLNGTKLPSGDIEFSFPANDLGEIPAGSDLRLQCESKLKEVLGDKAELVGTVKGGNDVLVELTMKDGVRLRDLEIRGEDLASVPFQRAIILTTANPEPCADFHSRVFMRIGDGVPEDVACGSAHCTVAPYYAARFASAAGVAIENKELRATTGNSKRDGALRVVWDGKTGSEGGRVKIRGRAFVVAEGEVFI